jgi:hypothetical protein
MRRTTMWMVLVGVALTVIPLVPGGVASAAKETHCVVAVTGQAADGELQTTAPQCFSTFSAAMEAAGVPASLAREPRARLLAQPAVATTFNLGVHFDGLNKTGSSFTVTGADCTGGWLNLSAAWINRVSSTANGCGHIWHFDGNNLTGSSQVTTSSNWNLTTLNNLTNSIQYLP